MHDSSEPEIDRPTITLGPNQIEVDEDLAPLVADILTETDIHLIDTYVERRASGVVSGHFVFPSSDDADSFLSLTGTVWEEQQDNLICRGGPEDHLQGWGIYPATFSAEALAQIYSSHHDDCDSEEYDEDEHEEYDEDEYDGFHDPNTPIDECDCGLWHIAVGIVVSIPVDTAGEFARRFQRFINERNGREANLQKEFEGIAGLEEFM